MLVVDAHADIGEGPVWDCAREILVWLDITGRLIHEYDPATGTDATFRVPLPVGAVALREQGGLVLAMEDGFWLCGPGVSNLKRFAPVEQDKPENRMNDGKADSKGRFWAGTMAYDTERPNHAALYRLEPDGTVETMVSPVSLSNGIDWSPDEKTMYFADSFANTLDVFDYEAASGRISNRRTLVEMASSVGHVDGLCVDDEGYVWLAIWGSSEVRRYSPAGEVDSVLQLPVTQVSSVAFGGQDLGDLYVTSAAADLSDAQLAKQPHAGALFRCRPRTKGRLPFKFAG